MIEEWFAIALDWLIVNQEAVKQHGTVLGVLGVATGVLGIIANGLDREEDYD